MEHPSTLSDELAAKAGDLGALLQLLLPGTSEAVTRLREQVRNFCENPFASSLLLLGPIGSGKSTLARVIALLRYINLLPRDTQVEVLKCVRFDGPVRVDKKILPWYEEALITGRDEDAANALLFGVAKGAFTGVDPRIGIFQQAACGHDLKNPGPGARITDGVVLLDEISDLPTNLQPKLLLLLTGVEVFRHGGEGNPDYGFSFRGTTIAGTWQNPAGRLRGDLLSRLSDYKIEMPSLEDRAEDFPVIVPHVVADIKRRLAEEAKRLGEISPIDRAKLASIERRRIEVTEEDVKLLATHRWSKSGELRSLRQVLQRLADGISVQKALDRQMTISSKVGSPVDVHELAEDILSLLTPVEGGAAGFAEHLNEVFRRIRASIADRLMADPLELERVARKIGMDPGRLRDQLSDLKRVRKTERGGA